LSFLERDRVSARCSAPNHRIRAMRIPIAVANMVAFHSLKRDDDGSAARFFRRSRAAGRYALYPDRTRRQIPKRYPPLMPWTSARSSPPRWLRPALPHAPARAINGCMRSSTTASGSSLGRTISASASKPRPPVTGQTSRVGGPKPGLVRERKRSVSPIRRGSRNPRQSAASVRSRQKRPPAGEAERDRRACHDRYRVWRVARRTIPNSPRSAPSSTHPSPGRSTCPAGAQSQLPTTRRKPTALR
jgi:hypothetical protein